MFSHYNTYADIKEATLPLQEELCVLVSLGGGTAEPQDDAGRGGGTEEAVKQENKR